MLGSLTLIIDLCISKSVNTATEYSTLSKDHSMSMTLCVHIAKLLSQPLLISLRLVSQRFPFSMLSSSGNLSSQQLVLLMQ